MRWNFKSQVNAIGVLAVLVVGTFVGNDLLRSRATPPCSVRYKGPTEFSLTRKGGAPLTPGELEANAGAAENGVRTKASVVNATGGPSPVALAVSVGGPVESDTGTSFFWSPTSAKQPAAACLAYDFHVPAEFDYARGGRLPGLFGKNFAGFSAPNPNSVGTRLTWDDSGELALDAIAAALPEAPSVEQRMRDSAHMKMPRGRWVHVEQEVVLNSENATNGILRLWIDGELLVEETDVVWRQVDSLSLAGLWVDIGYLSFGGTERPAKSMSVIMVSPPRASFE